MRVLIVGQKADPHVAAVAEHLSVSVELFDCHSFHSIALPTQSLPELTRDCIDDFDSIWWRLKWPVFDRKSPVAKLDEGDFELWRQEWSHTLWSVAFSARAPLINDPLRSHHASLKPVQLRVAASLGFEIPETLISNDPNRVREFARDAPETLVLKKLSHAFVNVESDVAHLGLAEVQSAYLSDHAEAARTAPVIAQHKVPKSHELRVTVVGDTVFTTKIETPASAEGDGDWRRTLHKNRYSSAETPAVLDVPLRRYMRYFGLEVGAFDFAVTPDGRIVFFECNPEGQWLWAENLTGQPISAEVARLLESGVQERPMYHADSVRGHGRVSDFTGREFDRATR